MKQPWGIKLNVIVLALAGLLTLLGALALLVMGAAFFDLLLPFASILSAVAVLLFLLAGFELFLAYSLWKHEEWAWWLLTIFGVIGVIMDGLSILTGTISITGIIFGVILLMGLLHKDTIKAIKPNIEWKGWG